MGRGSDVYYKYVHKPEKNKILGKEPTAYLNRFNVYTFPGMLFSKSYLMHRIAYIFELALKKIRGVYKFPFDYRSDFSLAWKDYGWVKTRELIGEMKTLLKEKNTPLLIVIYPVSDQVNDNYLKINRDYVLYPLEKIKEICKDYDIHHLDLTNTIYQNGGTKLFRDYLHMNKRGNDILAKKITEFLEANL